MFTEKKKVLAEAPGALTETSSQERPYTNM